MESHENLKNPMVSYGIRNLRKPKETYGNQWKPKETYENLWDPKETYGNL